MPSLTIDEDGTEFFYLDSGRPELEGSYTTLVILHGYIFHSGVFKRLIPLASSKGLRLICPNRRDYTGTTLYSPSDLTIISTGDEMELSTFLNSRGIEIALFLSRLIDELSLPMPVSAAHGDVGGLALVGWSLGNMATLSTVAAASSLSEKVKNKLQLYMRRLILFEPPSAALGFKNPPKHYVPVFDKALSTKERGVAFVTWSSGYYAHGDLSSRNLDNLSYRLPDPSKKASVSNMTDEDLATITEYAPASRSDQFIMTRFGKHLYQQTCKALFDPVVRATWHRMTVYVVHGDMAPWNVIYSAWEIENLANANKEQVVKISVIKDSNHFVIWDEPDKTIDAFLLCLQD